MKPRARVPFPPPVDLGIISARLAKETVGTKTPLTSLSQMPLGGSRLKEPRKESATTRDPSLLA